MRPLAELSSADCSWAQVLAGKAWLMSLPCVHDEVTQLLDVKSLLDLHIINITTQMCLPCCVLPNVL